MVPRISLRNVTVRFERGKDQFEAVRDLSLDVNDAEFFCLLGPSGCGKTTVLNVIGGFEAPVSGEVRVSGKLVKGPSPQHGVVFQSDAALFSWLSVRENVAFGPRIRGVAKSSARAMADHYLAMVGLTDHANRYPYQLSGGMKQRVQIARVLANEPEVMLMDEPFGALDAQTRRIMQRELAQVWSRNRRTVLFVTHDIDEAIILADRIGVMRAGPSSQVKAIVDNPLRRPRKRDQNSDALYEQVVGLIEEEMTHLTAES